MIVIERGEGEAVRVGGYVIRVAEVLGDEVVLTVLGPDEDGEEDVPEEE